MSWDALIQISQVAVIPALGYLIALERRLVKLETQIMIFLTTMNTKEQ